MRKAQSRNSGRSVRLPSATGAMVRQAYAKLLQANVDPLPLLKKAGLPRSLITNPTARVSMRDQIRFLNVAADALDDGLLGFHLAQLVDLREIGLIYYVLASSDQLGDALRRAVRYGTIVNDGIHPTLIEGPDIGIAMHYRGVVRHQDRHQAEIWIAAVVRIGRQLTGLRLVPRRVRIAHRREPGHGELAEFLGVEPEFGATADEIIFEGKARSLPLVGADPYLNRLLISIADDTLKHLPRQRGSFRAGVENILAPLLPHGGARAETVAARLGLSQRTFARRLSAEHTNFSEVTEQLRADLARRYLADPQLTVSEIAWLLGYREVAAFSRAFKRWTGKTPRDARDAA